ncbi:hypothetical protein [Escherichia phage EC.W2-6]|uniref:Macro domain-containing protein n=1 Tax=Escherichia phage EC.W8-1 TaxID=3236638 RepID=A0AB39CBN5_9CAUD
MAIVFEGKANVFTVDVQTVTCTVNLVGVMGAGVAKEYKRRYPEAFERYKVACNSGFQIGQLLLQRLNDGRLGLCFPTKKHWRNRSEIEWIEQGLQKLLLTYKDKGITSLAITPLGCGNGGLDYQSQVRPIMFKYLNQMDIPVYICL